MKLFSKVLAILSFVVISNIAIAADKININSADADALASALEGIGEAKAAAIVSYRTENGPFKSIEELANVEGIGDKTLELNIDRIIIEE